jgi:uncharacterized protein (TIGR03000 family)
MYSVVLMMALSGGADVPALNDVQAEPAAKYGDHGHKEYRLFGGRRGGCHGGGGGCCGSYGGCYGGGYGGCYGGGGYGCTGRVIYGGGYGGCTGGVGYGVVVGGCSGGIGGGYGGCSGGYYGSYGSSGSYGTYGGSYYSSMPFEGGYVSSPYGIPMYSNSTGPVIGGYQYGTPESGYYPSSNEATIVVRLPADAKLTFDGTATQSTDSVRTFTSPPLEPGKEYQYTLRAEMTRDGKKVERTRDVKVRAGQTSNVTIDFAEQLPAPGNK